MDNKRDVFLIGAKGISFYGGYESFVHKLLEYHQNNEKITYHVACKSNGKGCMNADSLNGLVYKDDLNFEYLNSHGYFISVNEKIGPAQAIQYDVKSLKYACKYIKENNIKNAVVYIMACRIGPFMRHYVNKIHKLGGVVYLNPDGHEWKRAKWSAPVRKYWKESERLMVKYSDLIICDSINIEKYIKKEYANYNPKTTFIAYGAEVSENTLADDDAKYVNWLNEHNLRDNEFYISVGRFVPENNFEVMIREFMKSNSTKDFAIITTDDEAFLNELDEKLHFKSDKRINFVGTVYDQELLSKIREKAYAYFHGHSVGGTNPSLLEALGSTRLNLLFDVGFNREVAENAALYWTSQPGDLAKLIDFADQMDIEKISEMGIAAKDRIKEAYSWKFITDRYESVFLNND